VGKRDVRTVEVPVMGMEGWALVDLKLIKINLNLKHLLLFVIL